MYTLNHFSRVMGIVVCLILVFFPGPSSQLPNDALSTAAPNLPFSLTYAFTAQLNLGMPSQPIPIPGGVRLIEPILNGTVSGPAINATIGYSLATPIATNNGTVQAPTINAVGTTDDGFPIYIFETGIGSPSGQVTRIQLEIGGGGAKYAGLQSGYILASVKPSSDRKIVTVIAYLVTT